MLIQRPLVRHFGKEQIWNWLLGIPVKGRLKDFDVYGELGVWGKEKRLNKKGNPYYVSRWMPKKANPYYMTGRFGFSGYWRCGWCPDWKLDEAIAFASEDCDMKEKWKRMVIWNYLFDCNEKTLEFLMAKTNSERKRHVISKLLETKK